MKPQPELAGVSAVFNLACECGEDPARVIRERLEAAERAAAAREYELRMQRTLAECPGVIGGDMPNSESAKGHVIIEPGRAFEARNWLKRRFYCADVLELSDTGLCIEVVPRVRKAGGRRGVRVSFAKPEQLKLTLI